MNGLFGTFGQGGGGYMMPQMQTPQQNVANYLRMPVAQAQPQQPKYPSMQEFMMAANQQNSASQTPLQNTIFDPMALQNIGVLQQISGFGTPVPQPQQKPTQTEQMLLNMSGYNNTTS